MMEGIYNLTSQTNIENWFDTLKDYTIKSLFLPLTKRDALVIIKLYKNKFDLVQLSPEEASIFDNLIKKIDKEITTISESNKAFVRLSTRSPKDSRKARNKQLQKYKAEKKNDENSNTLALLKSYLYGLQISSGYEALELLCDSERIYDDLKDALDNQETFNIKISIREWIDIPFEMEFRGFVKCNQLHALTQYYHYIYFDNLPIQKKKIAKRVQEFFEEIKDKISLEDYTIDFVVFEDKILILELKPFVPGTDAGLFSWKTERKILEKGPFELRIRTRPPLPRK